MEQPELVETTEKEAATSDAVIERWFSEAFFNVELPTEVFNRIRAAKDRLKGDVAALLQQRKV